MSPRTRTRLLKYPAHKSTLPPLPLSSLHHTTFIRCRQSDGPNSKATFGPHPILSALSWIPWDLRRAGNGSSTLYYIQYIAVFSSTTEHGGLKLKHRRKTKYPDWFEKTSAWAWAPDSGRVHAHAFGSVATVNILAWRKVIKHCFPSGPKSGMGRAR